MTIFDIIRYPISDTFTKEEWDQLPIEIQCEINARYSRMPRSSRSYPRIRAAYARMARDVIAEYNTK